MQNWQPAHEGLQSSDVTVCSLCASAVDHLATYMFLNQTKDKPTVKRAISAMPVVKPMRINAPNSVFALGNAFSISKN